MGLEIDERCRSTATEQLAALERGEYSAEELLEATQQAHDRVNPIINAIVSADFDRAAEAAAASDRRRTSGIPARPLEGLMIPVKDLEDTAGLRTTYGSAVYADHVPTTDTLLVERLRNAGAIVYGKTNTPEFGTGSHTYNRVFGVTRNPYDPSRTAGGSSGGAAAALAAGLASLADGSDMGGSLRNPAAFCNVVGFRPSIGRVPNWPSSNAWDTLATNGPMGRTVADVALLLSVMTGGDRRAPLSFSESFSPVLPESVEPLRIGWSQTVGGLDIEAGVTDVLERDGRPTLTALGHRVIDVEPDMTGADTAFRVLRGLSYARSFGRMLEDHPDDVGRELAENTRYGLGLTSADYHRAIEQRTRVYARMLDLFRDIDVLAAPVTAVLPFDAGTTWPRQINGVEQPDYLEWMRASWRITVTGFTAMSIPCGFSPEGLPVGLQLIAPPKSETLLLALAAQFERERPIWQETPDVLSSSERHHRDAGQLTSSTAHVAGTDSEVEA